MPVVMDDNGLPGTPRHHFLVQSDAPSPSRSESAARFDYDWRNVRNSELVIRIVGVFFADLRRNKFGTKGERTFQDVSSRLLSGVRVPVVRNLGTTKDNISATPWDDVGPKPTCTAHSASKSDPGCSDEDGLASDGVDVLVFDTSQASGADPCTDKHGVGRSMRGESPVDDLRDVLDLGADYLTTAREKSLQKVRKVCRGVDRQGRKAAARIAPRRQLGLVEEAKLKRQRYREIKFILGEGRTSGI